MSQACDAVVGPSDPRHDTEGYRSFLKLLHWELMRLPIPQSECGDSKGEGVSDIASVVELCYLAALIYLERAAGSFLEDKARVGQRIERAFCIMGGLEVCERLFPLLIFVFEARNDEQRITILDLIVRTEKNTPVRNLEFMKSMIQSIWVQDDLADENIGYVDRMSFILSTSKSLPTFV